MKIETEVVNRHDSFGQDLHVVARDINLGKESADKVWARVLEEVVSKISDILVEQNFLEITEKINAEQIANMVLIETAKKASNKLVD